MPLFPTLEAMSFSHKAFSFFGSEPLPLSTGRIGLPLLHSGNIGLEGLEIHSRSVHRGICMSGGSRGFEDGFGSHHWFRFERSKGNGGESGSERILLRGFCQGSLVIECNLLSSDELFIVDPHHNHHVVF